MLDYVVLKWFLIEVVILDLVLRLVCTYMMNAVRAIDKYYGGAIDVAEYKIVEAENIPHTTALAKEADRASRADYRDGVGDILTVLTAQSRVLQFSGQLISIRRLRLDNRVNLHLALGGDFKPNAIK